MIVILVLEKEITQAKKNQIKSVLAQQKCMIHEPGGSGQNILGVIGKCDKENLLAMEGVRDVVPITTA